jgi:predicted signal transduction protein with EAL and GGDEF domain
MLLLLIYFNFQETFIKLISALIILVFMTYGSTLAATKDKSTLMSDELLSGMKLRNIGPAYMSGRVADIAVDTKDPSSWFVAVGDKLLITMTHRMKEALREGDTLARLGGDAFVSVLADLDKIHSCEPLSARLLLAASAPGFIDDLRLNVTASLGVTIFPEDNVSADIHLRQADQAMYAAKALGKNRYHLFDTAQDIASKTHRESLEAVRIALTKNQFVLFYQLIEVWHRVESLLEMGCSLAQGYAITQPMPASKIPAWIKSCRTDTTWKILMLLKATFQ